MAGHRTQLLRAPSCPACAAGGRLVSLGERQGHPCTHVPHLLLFDRARKYGRWKANGMVIPARRALPAARRACKKTASVRRACCVLLLLAADPNTPTPTCTPPYLYILACATTTATDDSSLASGQTPPAATADAPRPSAVLPTVLS